MTGTNAVAGTIVVGIDDSADSAAALEWALDECARGGLRLHLVHATRTRACTPSRPGASEDHPIGEVMRRAVDRARRHDPSIRPTWSQIPGSPVACLVDASASAVEVVLGSGRAGTVRSVMLGSVAVGVATRAHCPVVLVRDPVTERPRNAPVVVGIGEGALVQQVLGYAFEQAARRGADLVAVRAWEVDMAAYAYGLPAAVLDGGRGVQHDRSLVDRALHGWRTRYPQVVVRRRSLLSAAVPALVRQSEGAGLLVVGGHERHELGGLLLGSVSQGVMRQASCPVVVVRGTRPFPSAAAAHAGGVQEPGAAGHSRGAE